MRVLKTLLNALPLGALGAALLVFWQGATKGEMRTFLVGAIVVVFVSQTLRSWLTHPQGHPLGLLRMGLVREASRLPTEEVVRRAGDNTYVYVEQVEGNDDGVLILWCFDGSVLEFMEKKNRQRLAVPTHGFRLNLETNEVDHYFGFVLLEWNQREQTFSIMSPPEQQVGEWQSVSSVEAEKVAGYKRTLAWVSSAIGGHTIPRGRRNRFHR